VIVPMNPGDARLIDHIQHATLGARTLLCTLARRGKLLERAEPQRAAFLLAAVRGHPLYKAGRLAFDMLEIEDLMLDASPVAPLDVGELVRVFGVAAWGGRLLVEVLGQLGVPGRDGQDGATATATPDRPPDHLLPRVRFEPSLDQAAAVDGHSDGAGNGNDPNSWPELLSSDYLYDYVVLGLLDGLGRAVTGA
jgi:hypothetical protein